MRRSTVLATGIISCLVWSVSILSPGLAHEAAKRQALGESRELFATVNDTPENLQAANTNVALASNGGIATASSYLGSPYNLYPSYVIDGSRRALNGNGWLDATYQSWPDWIQVDFNGSKTIDEIDVVTQQDDYQNPVEPTLSQTFSLYGITAFDVQYWTGSVWATVSNGSVTGNNKVWRQFTFSPITTSKIRIVVNSGADNTYSRVVEVEAWTAANVASAAYGASVTSSSYLCNSYNTYPGYVIDGARRALNGNIWLDGTYQSWPDWIQVDFNGSRTINEIDVVTQQDDYQNPVEPTLSQTFSLYGITAFDVQYWTGSVWAMVPNGGVTGNNKVWRQFTFSPITTSKIRIVVNSGADNTYTRIVEVEAWSTETISPPAPTSYTVTDLGVLTPGGTSKAFGINNSATVVGGSGGHPFIWVGGVMYDLGTFGGSSGSASSINETGFVAGAADTSGNGGSRPFLWSPCSGKQDLGPIVTGSESTSATGINNVSPVKVVGVGEVDPNTLSDRGFVWTNTTPPTGMEIIQSAFGGSDTWARGINNLGQIVGNASNSQLLDRAFIRTGTQMTDLGTISTGRWSRATAINNSGVVIGYSEAVWPTPVGSPSQTHAFIWTSPGGMTDIGTLGGAESYAYALNDWNVVGGWSFNASWQVRAFVYDSVNGMRDLNNLTPGSGWTLQWVSGINNRGQIVGYGVNPSGQIHAFLLTPVP